MPYRDPPLTTGFYYHVYNRGINKQTIFEVEKNFQHSLELIRYYSCADNKIRFSKLLPLPTKQRKDYLNKIYSSTNRLIDIVVYCLMPNHFHFILRQNKDGGISKFMADFQNSYSLYFNNKNNKFGPILQGPFKAILIEDDNYLLHLSRYIHLNPYSSGIIKLKKDLKSYIWSSLAEYLDETNLEICHSNIILSHFKTRLDYWQYVVEQADYQRDLKLIEHLIIESDI